MIVPRSVTSLVGVKDVLPLHPELAKELRDWLDGLHADEPLFPRLDRKKTWLMVQKDLERVGIPYESEEGIADFHAAGRHSYVTGLLRNGASITEARELARHADVRMTMKYTHIGLEDQARALASLPAPGGAQRLSSAPAVVSGHASAAAHTNELGDARPVNDETPSGEGVSSSVVVASQELAVDVRSGGGGNCTRVPICFGDGVYMRIQPLDCRPRIPDWRGIVRLSSSCF